MYFDDNIFKFSLGNFKVCKPVLKNTTYRKMNENIRKQDIYPCACITYRVRNIKLITECETHDSRKNPLVFIRDSIAWLSILWFPLVSVSKVCTSGGRHRKPYRFRDSEFYSTAHHTWTFPVNKITIKITECSKIWDKMGNFLEFLICFQYSKFFFDFMCWQAR